MKRILKDLLAVALITALCLSTLWGMAAYADSNSGTRAALGGTLTYWINVKYDGRDKNATVSSDSQTALVTSDIIEVTDKLPDGLTFQDFVHIDSGLFGATSRDGKNTALNGFVIDDSDSTNYQAGIWDSTNTNYNYHGLHYNKDTREVTFKVQGLTAGAQLSIGVKVKVPSSVDDPATSTVEKRRDFYNTVFINENKTFDQSNTLHHYILNNSVDESDPTQTGEDKLHKVTYSLAQSCDGCGYKVPAVREYAEGANVYLEANFADTETVRFDGWTVTGATVTNGKFTMPNKDVTIVGNCSQIPQEQLPAKHTVKYEIDGDSPEGFILPSEKEYTVGTSVKVDILEAGTEFNGYRFLGWTTDDVTVESTTGAFEMPDSDVTFTGSWELIKYRVIYEFTGDLPDNAGSLLPASFEVVPETIVTPPEIADQGLYIFLGWDKGEFAMPEENVVITGEWTKLPGSFTPEIKIEVQNPKENDAPFELDDEIEYKVTITNNDDFAIFDIIIKELNERISFEDIEYSDTTTENPYTLIKDTELKIYEIPPNGEVSFTYKYKVGKYDRTELLNTVRITDATAANNYVFDDTKTDAEGKALVEASVKSPTDVPDIEKVTMSYHPNKDEADLLPNESIMSYVFENPTEHKLMGNMFEPPAGQEFDKWDLGAPNTEITLNESKMTKALWKPLGATMVDVTFDANGHGTAPAPQRIVSGTKAEKPADPTEANYVFGGWYLESTCENEFDFSAEITSDTKLFAKWSDDKNNNGTADKDESFKVIYRPGEHGAFTEAVYEGLKAEDDTPPAPTPTPKKDYVFKAWTPDPASKPKVLAADANKNSEIIYTATWANDKNNDGIPDDDNIYTVKFDANGKKITKNAPAEQRVRYGNKASRPDKNPSADKAVFVGYYKEGACITLFDFDTEEITTDTTIYVKWLDDKNSNGTADIDENYTIVFNPNGGDWDGDTSDRVEDYHYGKEITIVEAPTREGYVFEYWKGSKYYPGEKYMVKADHTFTAVWTAESSIPHTGDDNNIYLYIIMFVSAILMLGMTVYAVFKNKENRVRALSILLAAGLVWTIIYPSGTINVSADDAGVVSEVESEPFLYTTESGEGFTITKEAHWTGLHQAELNIRIDSEYVEQPYDHILLGVDVSSGKHDIDQILDGSAAPSTEYQTAVKEVIDELNAHGGYDAAFTYNALDSEQVNKDKANIGLQLKDGTSTRDKKTQKSWGMDLFYGIHSGIGGEITWGPKEVRSYKDSYGIPCDRNGNYIGEVERDYKFTSKESCSWTEVTCDPRYDSEGKKTHYVCEVTGHGSDIGHCSVLERDPKPDETISGSVGGGGGSCSLVTRTIDPSEIYDDTNDNILVVLFDSGESYISPEERKTFKYQVPGGVSLVETTYTDTGKTEVRADEGDPTTHTGYYDTAYIYETQQLIKENFPNAIIVTVRNNGKDSGRTYGKFFADYSYTTAASGSKSYKELLSNGTLEGVGPNGLTFDINDAISNYFTAVSVSADEGEVSLSSNKDRVVWNYSGYMPTGSSRTIKVKLKLKDTSYDGLVPTNNGVTTNYRLRTQDSKTTGTTDITPVLKTKYSVIYDANAPAGSGLSGWTERRSPFEVVKISNRELSCPGYEFKGFEISTDDVTMLTSETFIMPVGDVTIRAIWGKPSVSKTNEGAVHSNLSLAQHIQNLKQNNTSGLSATDPDGNIRYVGASPANYVRFNNEVWRIIGVFNVDDGKGNVQKRVKLIKQLSIGEFSWDTSSINAGYGANEWGTINGTYTKLLQELNSLGEFKNAGYLNANSSSGTEKWYDDKNGDKGGTYNRSNNLTAKSQSLIGNAKWHTGSANNNNGSELALTNSSFNARYAYIHERGAGSGKVCSVGTKYCDSYTRTTSWVGKVGLMLPSDYLYSAGTNSCELKEGGKWTTECMNSSWIHSLIRGSEGFSEAWTMSPYSKSSEACNVIVYWKGYLDVEDAASNYAWAQTHPVVFLLPDVYITGGNGTSGNPYTLGLPAN